MQMRIVSALKPLEPLPIHPGKSKDMSQQGALGLLAHRNNEAVHSLLTMDGHDWSE